MAKTAGESGGGAVELCFMIKRGYICNRYIRNCIIAPRSRTEGTQAPLSFLIEALEESKGFSEERKPDQDRCRSGAGKHGGNDEYLSERRVAGTFKEFAEQKKRSDRGAENCRRKPLPPEVMKQIYLLQIYLQQVYLSCFTALRVICRTRAK